MTWGQIWQKKFGAARRRSDKALLATLERDIADGERLARAAPNYFKLKPGDPMFEMVEANKKVGRWVCDSTDHNEPTGCSNPDCFKAAQKRIAHAFGRPIDQSASQSYVKRDSQGVRK